MVKCALDEANLAFTEEFGEQVTSAQLEIVRKCRKGEEAMERLLRERSAVYEHDKDITEDILNLLHFKNQLFFVKRALLAWDDSPYAKRLNENFYLQLADAAKRAHNLEDTELVDQLVCFLMEVKVQMSGVVEQERVKKVAKVCVELVAKEWKDARLLVST